MCVLEEVGKYVSEKLNNDDADSNCISKLLRDDHKFLLLANELFFGCLLEIKNSATPLQPHPWSPMLSMRDNELTLEFSITKPGENTSYKSLKLKFKKGVVDQLDLYSDVSVYYTFIYESKMLIVFHDWRASKKAPFKYKIVEVEIKKHRVEDLVNY